MRFELRDKQILHDRLLVDEYPSKGDAMSVFNMLETAYNEGYTEGLSAGEAKFYRVKYRSETKTNFRWILYVVLSLSLLGLTLALATLSAGWVLIALALSVTAGGSLYGLGRIERVTF